ncbi:MAG TPA: hypothetical protein PJ991_00375 [Kiritimatiellia bacterium]|nr:hypothetical protein [Kiritimatiellia bacterium]
MAESTLFLLHLSATAYMTGIIWFVQLIHYPWFHDIPVNRFVAYHHKYTRIMGYVVGPAMLIELITGILLLFALPMILGAFNVGLLVIIWVSTFTIQIPCHHQLSRGYNLDVHQRLVQFNWIRTFAWSIRLVSLVAIRNLSHLND